MVLALLWGHVDLQGFVRRPGGGRRGCRPCSIVVFLPREFDSLFLRISSSFRSGSITQGGRWRRISRSSTATWTYFSSQCPDTCTVDVKLYETLLLLLCCTVGCYPPSFSKRFPSLIGRITVYRVASFSRRNLQLVHFFASPRYPGFEGRTTPPPAAAS